MKLLAYRVLIASSLLASLAYLVWREEVAMLVGQGFEVAAEPEQLAAMSRFSDDLKVALGME